MRVIGEMAEPVRPKRWLPSMGEIIYKMAFVGMSRAEMAYALGIKDETFAAWDCQSIASVCLRNGGVSKYDPNASYEDQSIYDLIMRGRSLRHMYAQAPMTLPGHHISLSPAAEPVLRWLFDTPMHHFVDEWYEDVFIIKLRRPAELCQKRWLKGSSESMLNFGIPGEHKEAHDLLNDWRVPKCKREAFLVEIGVAVHGSLCTKRFWRRIS